ncbi:hypothetical protein E2C01_081410 [Portunus trituberculatus]|uniref:Uncharacterized protein n=1 Tax=Portunus trituberculatus TaxID=210409 RepID=A0A5B7IY59_PORTR|nr:hypothetical protein [Portunus trituberculatus]
MFPLQYFDVNEWETMAGVAAWLRLALVRVVGPLMANLIQGFESWSHPREGRTTLGISRNATMSFVKRHREKNANREK